jgi:Icc-related predicted phosphoesterase
MKAYLVNNEHEWIAVLDKLYKSGYSWAYGSSSDPAVSFDEWYRLNTLKNEKFPVIILAGNDDDKVLYYCHTDYMKKLYPNEYIKMIRREKIKRIENESSMYK